MGATSVTGVSGPGMAGAKADPISNVNHVLFASSANDGDTLSTDINTVFLTFDDDYTLNLPAASENVGRQIYFRSKDINGHTVTLNDVYGGSWNFSSSWTNIVLISDGTEWNVMSWYSDD